MTWLLGLGLFILVLASNFTGYLLPWDQLAYWATTISIGMLEYIPGVGTWLENTIRGGPEMGPATLRIFFAIHTAVLPFGVALLMAFHFWRVRKAGGLVIATSPGAPGHASLATTTGTCVRLCIELACLTSVRRT